MLLNQSQPKLFQQPVLTTLQRRMFLDKFKKDYAYRAIFNPSRLRLEYSRLLACEYQNTMPVIHLDLAAVHGRTYEEVERSFTKYMAGIFKLHYEQVASYLWNTTETGHYSGTSETKVHRRYESVMENASKIPANYLLKELMSVLHKVDHKKVMVLIDNIDLPVLRVRPEDREMTQRLFESICSAALKDNKHLGACWVTGVLPVYVPNNLVVDPRYRNYYRDFFPEDDNTPDFISPDYTEVIESILQKIDGAGKCPVVVEKLQNLINGGSVRIYPLEYHGKTSFLDYYDENDLFRTLYRLGLLKEKNPGENNTHDDRELMLSNEFAKKYLQENVKIKLDAVNQENQSELPAAGIRV